MPLAAPTSGWFPLPARYESVATSGLKYTLGPGEVKQDIDLK